MTKRTGKQSENALWEINRMKAKITQRKRTIELLQAYNQQDEKRLGSILR